MSTENWRHLLSHPSEALPTAPAPAAIAPAQEARSGHQGDLQDLSPLPIAVNAFTFAADVTEASTEAPTDPELRKLWDDQLEWLRYLGTQIPYLTIHPVMALALGRAACLTRERVMLKAALAGIDELAGT